MNRTKIMIIGGHGEVGSLIVEALRDQDLILAGRNEKAMRAYCTQHRLQADIQVLDIHHFNPALFEDVRFLIVCVDQNETHLLSYCIAQGIDYMDVSANAAFIAKARRLPISSNSNVLLGVGIAPGVSNVLAETLLRETSASPSIYLDIYLGLGDHHGIAAIDWTLAAMVEPYTDPNGAPLQPFRHRNPLKITKQPTYNFNFADQHILKLKYPHTSFQTYLGFDQGWASRLFNLMARTHLLQALRFPFIRKQVSWLLNKKWLGNDSFKISAHTSTKTLSIRGHKQGIATGKIAALCAQMMLADSSKMGHVDMIDFISYDDLSKFDFLTATHHSHS